MATLTRLFLHLGVKILLGYSFIEHRRCLEMLRIFCFIVGFLLRRCRFLVIYYRLSREWSICTKLAPARLSCWWITVSGIDTLESTFTNYLSVLHHDCPIWPIRRSIRGSGGPGYHYARSVRHFLRILSFALKCCYWLCLDYIFKVLTLLVSWRFSVME